MGDHQLTFGNDEDVVGKDEAFHLDDVSHKFESGSHDDGGHHHGKGASLWYAALSVMWGANATCKAVVKRQGFEEGNVCSEDVRRHSCLCGEFVEGRRA